MSHSHIFVARLFLCAMSTWVGVNAYAGDKNLIVTIPAPMSELINNGKSDTKTNDIAKSGLIPNHDCARNDLFLDETMDSYQNRIGSIKWKQENHSCDARFAINRIKGQANVPFHHMSVDAGLDASQVNEWIKFKETDKAYLVTFVPTPFSFETMGKADELGKLYARRIWKVSTGLGKNNIGKIIINKNSDNAKIVDAVVTELISDSRKTIGDSDYSTLKNHLEVNQVAGNSSFSPELINLSRKLNAIEIAKKNKKSVKGTASSDANILVISSLHDYFGQFQRIDFAKDNELDKMLKSVGNGVKTVQLLKTVKLIIKEHPEALRSLGETLLKKLPAMFAPNEKAIENNTEVNRLAGLMSAYLPSALFDEYECRDITGILLSVIQGQGESITVDFDLEDLLMKSMAALSPVITEMAIESVNNLLEVTGSTMAAQTAAVKNQVYSTKELNSLFFQDVELSSQDSFEGIFTEINTVFARLKEFYLHAFDGILLIDSQIGDTRTPASEEIIEQQVQAQKCATQSYKLLVRPFSDVEADVDLKQSEPNAGIIVPVTNSHAEPLESDRIKSEIEKQLTAAANSLPNIVSTNASGQLEQLLAVMTQQSFSLVDTLKNITVGGKSSYYLQLILTPRNTSYMKKALSGVNSLVTTENLLPAGGDPACDARNVLMVVDVLFKSDGTFNFNFQWGLQLPRQFNQALSEFTGEKEGLVVKNSPGKPDQVHISHFQLIKPRGENRSHFALFSLSASGRNGLDTINGNIKFGPQMSVVFDDHFDQNRAYDFSNKQNILIHTPKYADVFNSKIKNSSSGPSEIIWSIWKSLKARIFKGNVCSENVTFGPIVNLHKAYPAPLQPAFNKLGYHDVLLHSGKARLDELGFEMKIDPTKVSLENYTPTLNLNKFELQVFVYNLEGKDSNNNSRFFDMGDWLCFPLPHNKEEQIVKGLSETLNKKMPNIWAKARGTLNKVKAIAGKTSLNPTGDVEKIDTDFILEK